MVFKEPLEYKNQPLFPNDRVSTLQQLLNILYSCNHTFSPTFWVSNMLLVYHGHRMKWKMRSVPCYYLVGCCSLVSACIEEKEDALSLCTCNDISRWPRLSNRHQNMHLTKLHTPFSHIPSQSPLCCPHNGNPNTQERFFSMQMWKPYRKKEKHAVQDSSCAQRKQYSVKCLCRWPDNLPPFNYAASSISTWQILKDMTSSSQLNPN